MGVENQKSLVYDRPITPGVSKMTQYPRLQSFLNNISIDDINAELNALADDHMIEPIDDPSIDVGFWDWADVVGIVDECCPEEPFWAEVN